MQENQSQIDALHVQLEERAAVIAQLQQVEAETQASVKQLEDHLEGQSKQMDELKQALCEQQAENTLLKESASNHSRAVEELESKASALQKSLEMADNRETKVISIAHGWMRSTNSTTNHPPFSVLVSVQE